jgi:glucosamine--fructose-6-phosphate aminotransferase (isomerizing)
MCGIVGYLGKNQVLPIMVDGLKRLEYRGYDSSGIAVMSGREVVCVKAVGKISELEKKINSHSFAGIDLGIAHTRWATHGKPTETNAHPHTDCHNKIWLVHNGIIENYRQLKEKLESKGHKFVSETDSEVVAHLVEDFYQGNLTESLIKALKIIKGTYGLALFHADEPNKLLAARCGSPLLIGLADGETIIASDASAIIKFTRQIIYLNDGEIAEINGGSFRILDGNNQEVVKEINQIGWNIDECEKNGYPHFMLKEIFEQPGTIVNSIRGRSIAKVGKAKLGGLENEIKRLRTINKIVIVACGTARHAGLVGEHMLEDYAGIATEVNDASEFRYRRLALDKYTAVLAISQSGETADTLAAIREAKEKGILTLGIVNVVGSTIARDTDAGIYNHIGPEISVASTKAFTSQVSVLALLTVLLGRQRQMSLATGQRIITELEALPEKIKIILKQAEAIKAIAQKYYQYNNFAFLGRKYNYAVAHEGALKLKEISYIHAEGFAAGEMKHGAIAMINEDFPSLFICPQDSVYEKNLSNIEEIKSRNGKVIALATAGDDKIGRLVDEVIYLPKTLEMLTPIIAAVPLQLFAYYMAELNNRDIDQPRNLAKSVTVE